MQLGFLRQNVASLAKRPSPRRPLKRRRALFDCLEDRRLLAVTVPGSEFQVPGTAAGVAFTSNKGVAMDAKGDAVVAWADSQTTGSNGLPSAPWNLTYQLYTNNSGTLSGGAQNHFATVSINPLFLNLSVMVARAPTSGNFAIAWGYETTTKQGADIYSTYAELFSANGAALTGAIQVGGNHSNQLAGLTMSDSGFDVLYGAYPFSGSNLHSWAVQQYSSAGATVGKPISVVQPNDMGGNAAIAMDATGNFAVVWDDSTSSNQMSVFAERYASTGAAAGGVIQVTAPITGVLSGVNAGMDSNDDLVVNWNGSALFTETVSGGTNALSNPVAVASTDGDQAAISVQSNGNYALSWVTYSPSPTPTWTVYADTFFVSGVAQQSPFVVTSVASQYAKQHAAVALDGVGDLLDVWSGYGSHSNGNGTYTTYTDGGVFGEFYLDPPAPTATAPATSSPIGAASPGGTSAAADAVFASYAYPEDEDALA